MIVRMFHLFMSDVRSVYERFILNDGVFYLLFGASIFNGFGLASVIFVLDSKDILYLLTDEFSSFFVWLSIWYSVTMTTFFLLLFAMYLRGKIQQVGRYFTNLVYRAQSMEKRKNGL